MRIWDPTNRVMNVLWLPDRKALRAHPQVILAPAVHRKRLAVADVVDKQRDVCLQKLNGLRPKPAKPSHSQNSVMPLLYPLLFGQLADKEDSVMFADNTVLQALDDHLLTFWHLYHIAFCFYQCHGASNDRIIILISCGQAMQATPGPEVTPSEFRRQNVCNLCLFHNSIVY